MIKVEVGVEQHQLASVSICLTRGEEYCFIFGKILNMDVSGFYCIRLELIMFGQVVHKTRYKNIENVML